MSIRPWTSRPGRGNPGARPRLPGHERTSPPPSPRRRPALPVPALVACSAAAASDVAAGIRAARCARDRAAERWHRMAAPTPAATSAVADSSSRSRVSSMSTMSRPIARGSRGRLDDRPHDHLDERRRAVQRPRPGRRDQGCRSFAITLREGHGPEEVACIAIAETHKTESPSRPTGRARTRSATRPAAPPRSRSSSASPQRESADHRRPGPPARGVRTPRRATCATIPPVNPLDLVAIVLVVLAVLLGFRSGALPQVGGLLGAIAGGALACCRCRSWSSRSGTCRPGSGRSSSSAASCCGRRSGNRSGRRSAG